MMLAWRIKKALEKEGLTPSLKFSTDFELEDHSVQITRDLSIDIASSIQDPSYAALIYHDRERRTFTYVKEYEGDSLKNPIIVTNMVKDVLAFLQELNT